MLRRLIIVVVLFWVMAQNTLLRGDEAAAIDPTAMLAFGFIVLAATTLGELAHKIHLPHVTGYILTGVVCGEHVLGLLSPEAVHELKLFDILAIGLIAMEAGAALDIEGLRRRWQSVGALTSAMIVLSLAGGLAFAGVTAGYVPGVGMPLLDGAPVGMVLAVGLLLGVMILATSPPVTLAVVNDSRARGDFTESVLTSVIINNAQVVVLFAVALAAAQSLVGDAGQAVGPGAVLAQFAWSVALGIVIGGLAAAALRAMGKDALLAIVGLAFVGYWLASSAGASPLLTFLVSGAFLNGVTRQGPAFKGAAQMLSGPVYVLFFTLVGADLHLDAIRTMAPFAVALVLVRLGGFWLSVQLADRLVPLSIPMRRFAAMGLAPQAGIALTIALGVGNAFPGWGAGFETLGLAAIALNEMIGPVLLKFALNLSGEAGESDRAAAAAEGQEDGEATPALTPTEEALAWWLPEPGRVLADPWADLPRSGIRRIDEVNREVQAELQALVRDLKAGPVARRREAGLTFLQQLRREFLRVHRRIGVQANDPEVTDEDLRQFVRAQRAELANNWKALLLNRSGEASYRSDLAALDALVRRVDKLVEDFPSATTGPLERSDLAHAEGDGPWLVVRKLFLRARTTLRGVFGQPPLLRVIELRALGRFHLSGGVPVALEEVAGLLTVAERHLLSRAEGLFETWFRSEAALLQRLVEDPAQMAADDRLALVTELRRELEEEFQVIAREVDRLADETVRVAANVLARAARAMAQACTEAGTPRLSPNEYRFSRVYRPRERAIARLREGFAAAQTLDRGAAAAMAMELELVRVRSEVLANIERTAAETSRDVRGRIAVQFGRVGEALDDAVGALQQLLRNPPATPGQLLEGFELIIRPLNQLADKAVAIVEEYQHQLEKESPFEALVASIGLALDQLTDRYTVVFQSAAPRGRGLPRSAVATTIPFRELVRSYVETRSQRDLTELSELLHQQVEAAWKGIRELDRALVFTTELVRSELELLPAGMIPPTTLETLQETLIGTLGRIAHRVEELRQAGATLADRTARDVEGATKGNLDKLRALLVAGRIGEVRALVARQSISRGARELRGLKASATRLAQAARAAVGEEAITEARRVLGLPELEAAGAPGPEVYAMPPVRVALPIAYRRLFSDETLEAGDLLSGRESQVARVRQVLLGEVGGSRAVSVIGVGGMGKEAIVGALLRGLAGRVRVERTTFTEPVTDVAQVDALLDQARECVEKHRQVVMVVEGIEWLFCLRPGGFEILRRFVAGVVGTCHGVGWLVSADRPVWAYANRVVHLNDAFPERFELNPLDLDGLRLAILSRHAMSGYKLHFHRTSTGALGWVRAQLGRRSGQEEAEDRFFRTLHQDSGGVLSDALHLWMASIVRVDTESETVIVGRPPHPPIAALRTLGDDELITLRQVARQGRLAPEEHAAQFRLEPEVSHAFLARLAHWGLLERDNHAWFRFHAELTGPLYRILRERRLVG